MSAAGEHPQHAHWIGSRELAGRHGVTDEQIEGAITRGQVRGVRASSSIAPTFGLWIVESSSFASWLSGKPSTVETVVVKPTIAIPSGLCTLSDAADIGRCSIAHLRRHLEVQGIGGRSYVDRAAVEALRDRPRVRRKPTPHDRRTVDEQGRLTVKGAALLAGVSIDVVRYHDDELRPVRVGSGHRRYDRERVLQWAARRRAA